MEKVEGAYTTVLRGKSTCVAVSQSRRALPHHQENTRRVDETGTEYNARFQKKNGWVPHNSEPGGRSTVENTAQCPPGNATTRGNTT